MFAGLAHFSVRKISRNGPPPQVCQRPDNWLSRRPVHAAHARMRWSRNYPDFADSIGVPVWQGAREPVSKPGILHDDWALGDKGWFIELARPALYALYGDLIIRGNFAQI